MTTGSIRRTALLASVALVAPVALLVPAPAHAATRSYIQATGGNGLFDAFTDGPVGTGAFSFFDTAEKITVDDQDFSSDVYRRSGDSITLASPGTSESAIYVAASTDGTALLYRTYGSVLPSDTDGGRSDIYRWANGTTTLMTPGADPTEDVLTAATNPAADKIVYYAGTTTKKFIVSSADGSPAISTPVLANAVWGGATTDLSRFWFTTSTSLPGNTDTGADDVYDFTTATQVNHLDTLGNGNPAAFADVTPDGSHVFWTTSANVGSDVDGFVDVYDTHAGTKTLVSGGTTGNAAYYDTTPDGTAVFYTTNAAIDGTDTDAAADVYRRVAATDTLMTPNGSSTAATFVDVVSADGSRLAFSTSAALTAADTDAGNDVYLSTGASPSAKTLLSGAGSASAGYDGATADLGQVFFDTDDLLLAADQDPWSDIYAGLPGGSIELVSVGTNGGNVGFGGTSPDGSHVLIASYERLAPTDTDNFIDVFDLSVPAPPTTPPDTTPPTGKLSASKKQKGPKKVVVSIGCGAEPCTATVSGQVTIGKKKLSVGPATVAVAAGKDAVVTLKLTGKVKKAVAKAFRKVSKVTVTVSATVADAAGNKATVAPVKVKLTRP
jgi:hypothetical protein